MNPALSDLPPCVPPATICRPPGRRGFSIVEALVLIGILLVLVSIFVPYIAKVRESEHRATCMDNLRKFGTAINYYAYNNDYLLPSVVYDVAKRPTGYTSFTGPDEHNPFAPESAVLANDVTASLFLLVRGGYISRGQELGLSMFICPSSNAAADTLHDATGRIVLNTQRSNFRSSNSLSYSYCSPFSSGLKFRMNSDWLYPDFAVMADRSAGVGGGSDVTAPAINSSPIELSRANSNNHGRAGQNVLYADGHVSFQSTPYCGVKADNIFTAATATPATTESTSLPAPGNGYFGRHYGPASWGDSYLVPSDNDRD